MMSDKQTRCPKCTTIYKVTLTQLTIAQGMVCCPKCSINFNALTHLVQPAVSSETRGSAIKKSTLPTHIGERKKIGSESSANILDIFERKIENSNIDLLTYLNNLNYFHNEARYHFQPCIFQGAMHLKKLPTLEVQDFIICSGAVSMYCWLWCLYYRYSGLTLK